MCGQEKEPVMSEAWQNLKQPMPLGRKLRLLIKNNWIKLKRRESCCGNYGEPGC